jgi:hypothetical protein
MTGPLDWTMHDAGEDFLRVRALVLEAATLGLDAETLANRLRDANAPGATVDLLVGLAKQHAGLPAGARMRWGKSGARTVIVTSQEGDRVTFLTDSNRGPTERRDSADRLYFDSEFAGRTATGARYVR